MAGLIPQNFIDDLLNRVDIVEVIDSRVALKKAGRDFTACCPFHNEKTPSFTVSQTKQFYHCFGCGANGSAVGFLMEYEHLEFPEAIEELASMSGLEVPRESQPRAENWKQQGPDLFKILQQADAFFQSQLRKHPDAPVAVEYLKNRGLSGEIAARFGIGFAPPGWENLAQLVANNSKAALDLGLLIRRDDGSSYDRFRNRIMFPIRDRRGRVIGFGGRVMGDESPKYMNSPESNVFHKGQELYGLFEARKAERNLQNVLVVEGYMDVVALAQHDINNAVATLGTATTDEHLQRIFRVVPEVIFCFDGDKAGQKAAWKALENILPLMLQGREAGFLFLPDGEDPDSLVRAEGTDRFRQRLTNATPLSSFFYDHLTEQVDVSTMDGRARLAELAKPLLNRLPDDLFREMMVNKLAELTRLDASLIKQRVITPQETMTNKPQQPRASKQEISCVRTAIQLLLHFPNLGASIDRPATWENLEIPGMPLLLEMLSLTQEKTDIQTGGLIEHWRDRPEARHLSSLASDTLSLDDDGYPAEFQGALRRLDQKYRNQRLDELRFIPITDLSPQEKEELKQLLR